MDHEPGAPAAGRRRSARRPARATAETCLPEGWTLSGAWQRAQAAEAHVGPSDDGAHYDVLLARENGDWGDKHRVLFAIQNGALHAECDCKAFQYRGWCAHVAHLWWGWTREQLGVRDLDADQVHLSPPWWLDISDDDQASTRRRAPTAPTNGQLVIAFTCTRKRAKPLSEPSPGGRHTDTPRIHETPSSPRVVASTAV